MMAICDVAQALSLELLLVLQHSDISTNSTAVCKLLCVSKSVQAAVMSMMRGQLPVATEFGSRALSARVHSFAAFAVRSGALIKELNISVRGSTNIQTIAAAIQSAALRPPGLQIQSFRSDTPVAQLLHQLLLFRTSLTKLDLEWNHRYSFEGIDEDIREHELVLCSLKTTELVLAGLPNLSILKLRIWNEDMPAAISSKLWRSLSSLTSITYLSILDVIDKQDLSYLPPQLKELYVSYRTSAENPHTDVGVPLAHLTSLTMFGSAVYTDQHASYLHFTDVVSSDMHTVTPGDRFPNSLCTMVLGDVQSVQPLLQLTHLQRLLLLACRPPFQNLAQLSRLTSLRSLDMMYYGDCDGEPDRAEAANHAHRASNAAPISILKAIACLPIRGFYLTSYNVSSAAVCFLRQFTGLTSLRLSDVYSSATPRQWANTLSHLAHLQVLSVQKPNINKDSPTEDQLLLGAGGGIRGLFRAIAGRPLLKHLELATPITTGLAEELQLLGGASQLTSLVLSHCDLENDATAEFLPQVPTGLKELNLSSNPHIGDATLELIGQRLQLLTNLELSCTEVTDRGLQHLTSLWQLKELEISGSRASEAAKVALLCH